MMLSLIIYGPRQPLTDIDAYLRPLIDELKILWDEDVEVFNGYEKQNFNLRTIIFYSINNFPTYGNLSDYSFQGHKECLICEEKTSF